MERENIIKTRVLSDYIGKKIRTNRMSKKIKAYIELLNELIYKELDKLIK